MEKITPIVTREETEDGWIVRSDYGKQGVSVGIVHVPRGTPEEAAKNRRNLNRVLKQFGYQLAETT